MANPYEKTFFAKMSSEIREIFGKLQEALKNRETQLLRQIEVLSQHCQLTESYEKYSKEISLVFENTNDLFESISSLGKINFSGLHCTSEAFQIEDYQKQETDHDSFNKYLNREIKSEVETETVTQEQVNKVMTKYQTETTTVLECIEKDDPNLCQHNAKQTTDDKIVEINSEYVNDDRNTNGQLQHWMNDILVETELEPTSNNIMEHSQIE